MSDLSYKQILKKYKNDPEKLNEAMLRLELLKLPGRLRNFDKIKEIYKNCIQQKGYWKESELARGVSTPHSPRSLVVRDNPQLAQFFPIIFNEPNKFTIQNISFADFPTTKLYNIYKDGRVFSHFIENWAEMMYPLKHIPGCKSYDFIGTDNEDKYDEKTFTKGGCKIMPSRMIGTGRSFDPEKFREHAAELNYMIVDNLDFPNIIVLFKKGSDLLSQYPKGTIPFKDRKKLFNL